MVDSCFRRRQIYPRRCHADRALLQHLCDCAGAVVGAGDLRQGVLCGAQYAGAGDLEMDDRNLRVDPDLCAAVPSGRRVGGWRWLRIWGSRRIRWRWRFCCHKCHRLVSIASLEWVEMGRAAVAAALAYVLVSMVMGLVIFGRLHGYGADLERIAVWFSGLGRGLCRDIADYGFEIGAAGFATRSGGGRSLDLRRLRSILHWAAVPAPTLFLPSSSSSESDKPLPAAVAPRISCTCRSHRGPVLHIRRPSRGHSLTHLRVPQAPLQLLVVVVVDRRLHAPDFARNRHVLYLQRRPKQRHTLRCWMTSLPLTINPIRSVATESRKFAITSTEAFALKRAS